MTLISHCPGHLWKAGLCLYSRDRTWCQAPDPTFLPLPETAVGGQEQQMGALSRFMADRHTLDFTRAVSAPTAAAETDLFKEGHLLGMP